jgi:spermidine synthase
VRNSAVYSLFFISGLCGLVYEVLWVRTLGLVLGVTVYAAGIVLASYMAGLAAGSYCLGRVADRNARNALSWYGTLEILIALSSLFASFVFISMSRPHGLVLPQVAACVTAGILLFVPTFFMGGTLPVISRYFIADAAQSGKSAGLLYGLNTLGGVTGCLLAGFFLVKVMGVRNAALSALFVNFCIGAAAVVMAQRRQTAVEHARTRALPARVDLPPKIHCVSLLVIYGISGFCSLGYEVLWTRALLFNLGNDTYAFSLMLATFLLGIGLGSAVVSRFVNRMANGAALLGLLQVLIGASVFAGTGLLYRMDVIVDWVWQHTGSSWPAAVFARFSGAALVMLVPAALVGALFPIVNRILAGRNPENSGVGRTVGTIYGANTLGAIAGSLCAGFVLIPFLGITNAILCLAGINVLLGVVWFIVLRKGAYFLASLAVLCLFLPATRVYSCRQPFPMHTAGLSKEGPGELLYYREGATASVALVKAADSALMLSVNGVYTAYTTIEDLQVHYLLGYLPYFLCPEPAEALVIGLGLGVTAASLHSAGMKVDCVELAKEEIGAAPFLGGYNDSILQKKGFSLIIGDGRHYLRTVKKRYDVITSNAVHVRLSPYLYTKEFYGLCRERLTPHGVVCQWLPSNNLPEKEFKQLIRAFQTVFPHTSVWYVNPGHYLLVGTPGPLAVDYGLFSKRCLEPAVQNKLGAVYLNNPLVVAGLFLLDEKNCRAYTSDCAPHTDDRPCAEFVRVIETRQGSDVIEFPATMTAALGSMVAKKNDSIACVFNSVAASAVHSRNGEFAEWFGRLEEAVSEYKKALSVFPDDGRTRYLLENVSARLKIIYLNMANELMQQKVLNEAGSVLRKALAVDSLFGPVWTHMGILYEMRSLPDSAVLFFKKAVRLSGRDAAPYVHLGSLYCDLGSFRKALETFEKAVTMDPRCAEAWFGVGYSCFLMGDRVRGEQAFTHAFALGLSGEYRQMAEEMLQGRQ